MSNLEVSVLGLGYFFLLFFPTRGTTRNRKQFSSSHALDVGFCRMLGADVGVTSPGVCAGVVVVSASGGTCRPEWKWFGAAEGEVRFFFGGVGL